jgi:hypothetical protein
MGRAAPASLSVVQADEFLDLSTTLVAPTSTSARPASFRPTITVGRQETRVLVQQTTVVDPQRLERSAVASDKPPGWNGLSGSDGTSSRQRHRIEIRG